VQPWRGVDSYKIPKDLNAARATGKLPDYRFSADIDC